MDNVAVGRRITERLEAIGMTAKQLAEQTGLSEGHISRMRNGRSGDLRHDDLRAIADVLRVSMSWLAEGDNRDFKTAVERLGADAALSQALTTISLWFDTTTDVEREVFRHSILRMAQLLSRRDTHIKELRSEDVVEFDRPMDDDDDDEDVDERSRSSG